MFRITVRVRGLGGGEVIPVPNSNPAAENVYRLSLCYQTRQYIEVCVHE